jgi:hypothetical protein
MNDAQTREFVLSISSLWNEQKIREVLYLEALKKDSMGSLRRMLTQGHFSALLFQKEIHWIYDYFKCFLTDKDLVTDKKIDIITVSELYDLEEKEEVAGYLKKTEGKILQSYKSISKYLDIDLEIRSVLNEHLDRISEFYEILSKQEKEKIKELKHSLAA